MSIVLVLVVVAVVGAVAVVLAGRTGGAAPAAPDRAPLELPDAADLAPRHVEAVRFGVGLRGYRMDQVDAVLDLAAAALAERDRRIAELTGAAPAGGADPDGEPGPVAPAGASGEAAAQAPAGPPPDPATRVGAPPADDPPAGA